MKMSSIIMRTSILTQEIIELVDTYFGYPGWASVNRAVLLCNDCCTIHRSLGRHISQVKSLKKGDWNAMQLAMVQNLVTHGANGIWEHSLLDPAQNKQGRRKPNPRDPLHPIKADFIRAKYQFLAFAFKNKDAEVTSVDDLNKQLHASVRTANLETSLRLLSLGADPNYFHPEKGTCALHVASSAGQSMQVELLLVYGADPGAYDSNGKIPSDHARIEKNMDMVDRLQEVQYELTDRLAYFLCGKKPDHRTGQHFIIPELSDSTLDFTDLAKTAKSKLQALPNHLFDKLAIDVYDEVDRRENNTLWLDCVGDTSVMMDRQTVPFLPVIPEYSSTRNQGRQKLARFNGREFATLIIDILSDARRRQVGVMSPGAGTLTSHPDRERVAVRGDRLKRSSSFSDDEPLYDSVASDEDYASIGDSHSIKDINGDDKISSMDSIASMDLDMTSGAFGNDCATPTQKSQVSVEEYLDVKRALADSQSTVKNLLYSNQDLKKEILQLKHLYKQDSLSGTSTPQEGVPTQQCVTNGNVEQIDSRPQSMFEPREGHQRHVGATYTKHSTTQKPDIDSELTSPHNPSALPVQSPIESTDGIYDNTAVLRSSGSSQSSAISAISHTTKSSSRTPSSEGGLSSGMGSLGVGGATPYPPDVQGGETKMPTQDDVVKKTERITKKIQQLLHSAQANDFSQYPLCGEKIHLAVADMIRIFPKSVHESSKHQSALKKLTSGAQRLRDECLVTADGSQTADSQTQTQIVIQCAYDIALAAKQLVVLFE